MAGEWAHVRGASPGSGCRGRSSRNRPKVGERACARSLVGLELGDELAALLGRTSARRGLRVKLFKKLTRVPNEPSQFSSFFNRLLGISAVLQGVLITLGSTASFCTAVHTAALLSIYGWRSAGLSATCLRATSKAGQHRRGTTLVTARHLFCLAPRRYEGSVLPFI
jgi:hypothetical protein